MKLRSPTVGLMALGCLSACHHPAPPEVAPIVDAAAARSHDANSQLDEVVREHIDASLAFSPTTASWLGVHTFDDRLDDPSPEAQLRELVRLQKVLARTAAISDDELDANHRIDRLLIEHDVRLALIELETRPMDRNPLRYVDLVSSGIDELLSREFAPLPDRLRSVDARLLRVRPLFDEARRNLKSPPELFTRRAIEMGQSLRGFLTETLPSTVGAVADDKLLAEFRFAQADALRALDEFLLWLQRDLTPRSKGEYALGRERLAERLRVGEGVEMPIEQLLALGEREMRTARQRYEETAKIVLPGKPTADAARSLDEDHATAETLLPSTREALESMADFVTKHHLATLPALVPQVSEMPAFMWGFASMSMAGPLEPRAREARFYVDPVDHAWNAAKREEHLRALNRPQLFVTALHEVIPGHFLQGESARAAPSVMQRYARSYVFVEGWANYAEQMMLAEGFAAGDVKVRLAEQREGLVRICRMVAVIRLHAMGAKLDDVAKLFADEALLDDYSAHREAERAAYDPMVLAHSLGRLQIAKLRDDVKAARGDGFKLGEFHDQLLAHGAAPLSILRGILLPGDTASTL